MVYYIAIPITYLFNKCITIGYFPNCLKIAKVIVIHKSGKKNNMGNYRPISLLPQISKILEKIIKERLLNYINKHNILCILFADDTTLLFTDMDHCALENKANKYIGYIYSWLCFNKLILNVDKTSYKTFCRL